MTIIMEPADGEVIAIGPTRTAVKLPGVATGGRLGVVQMTFPAGFGGPPPHAHDVIAHFWWVLDGELTMTIDGETHRLSTGCCAYVPSGTPHRFATAKQSAVLLEVDTPRTLENYLAELAAAFPVGSTVDQRVVADIQRRHDTHPV